MRMLGRLPPCLANNSSRQQIAEQCMPWESKNSQMKIMNEAATAYTAV